MNIAILYTIFAAVSTAANIGAQDLSTRLYSGLGAVPFSVFIGTGIGLVVKYVLDKKWIFKFKVANAKHDASTFALYTVMGIVTTVIFWAFEFGFNHAFHTKEARYIGAVIGLAIGYITKYQLDKRYVFATHRAS
ncbi:GtrA-like protein [Paraburkholderia sp. BL6669N2]|uniref:GtrA family protein n=1 Tax=Paraburkholderia sp. BL6669N2 TaxID=1938807 RepID=UPI000E25AFE3|nr:GtrA family protein [Paraburkholderia sp. BL6669N2]REG57762.1 GtrA-like protein [Paraburkholderia sp. BL6669N2]